MAEHSKAVAPFPKRKKIDKSNFARTNKKLPSDRSTGSVDMRESDDADAKMSRIGERTILIRSVKG